MFTVSQTLGKILKFYSISFKYILQVVESVTPRGLSGKSSGWNASKISFDTAVPVTVFFSTMTKQIVDTTLQGDGFPVLRWGEECVSSELQRK